MPAGYDAEVAELFRDLRAASGLSESELAAQLATRVEVVQALEHGALYALPAWPETYRVVSTYGTMLNLDVRPLLQRIYAQLDAGVVGLGPKSAPDMPTMPPADTARGPQMAPRSPQSQAQPPQGAPQRQPGAPPQQQPQRPQQGAVQPAGPQRQQAPQGRPPQLQGQRGQPMPPPNQPQAPRPNPQTPKGPQTFPAMPSGQPAPRQPAQAAAPAGAAASPLAAEPALQPSSKAASKADKPARKGWFKAPLLKWGVVALVASALLFGLWTWVAKPRLFGSSGPTAQTPAVSTDPNDPRSRKADRLPGPT